MIINARQLHGLLTVARLLPRAGVELLVEQLPSEVLALAVRLCNISGQLLNGPLGDLFQECAGLTGEEAAVAFLDRLLTLDRLTQVSLPRGPGGRLRQPTGDESAVCPN